MFNVNQKGTMTTSFDIIVVSSLLTSYWNQDVNWTYITCSEDFPDFFWTPFVCSIYMAKEVEHIHIQYVNFIFISEYDHEFP